MIELVGHSTQSVFPTFGGFAARSRAVHGHDPVVDILISRLSGCALAHLGGVAAQRLAERIADTAGADLVEVRPHQYVGRPGRIALYRRDGTLHALVPGGEVVLGYDGAWFTPTGGRVRQPRCRGRGPGDAWPAAAQPR